MTWGKNELFCWSGYLSWRKLYRKDDGVKYENVFELKGLVRGFDTKEARAKCNVPKFKNEFYTFLISWVSLEWIFGSNNDSSLIDYYIYQSTIFCIFRTVIYLIKKDAWTSRCNVYFFCNRNSSYLTAPGYVRKTSYGDDVHDLQHLRLQINISSQYIFQSRSKYFKIFWLVWIL